VTAKTTSPEAIMGDTLEGRLRALGTRGVLVQMAQRGQIIKLQCEMPNCYCHKGRSHFDPKSTPMSDWAPSADHYPRLKADGGLRIPLWFRFSAISSSDIPFSSIRLILIRHSWSRWLQRTCASRTFQGTRWPPSALSLG
jgi:hypothetical protein